MAVPINFIRYLLDKLESFPPHLTNYYNIYDTELTIDISKSCWERIYVNIEFYYFVCAKRRNKIVSLSTNVVSLCYQFFFIFFWLWLYTLIADCLPCVQSRFQIYLRIPRIKLQFWQHCICSSANLNFFCLHFENVNKWW